jgi:hypothetical protein
VVCSSVSVDLAAQQLHAEGVWAHVEKALCSPSSLIRNVAAKCMSQLCLHMTDAGLHVVVNTLLPKLDNPLSIPTRRGISELLFRRSFAA